MIICLLRSSLIGFNTRRPTGVAEPSNDENIIEFNVLAQHEPNLPMSHGTSALCSLRYGVAASAECWLQRPVNLGLVSRELGDVVSGNRRDAMDCSVVLDLSFLLHTVSVSKHCLRAVVLTLVPHPRSQDSPGASNDANKTLYNGLVFFVEPSHNVRFLSFLPCIFLYVSLASGLSSRSLHPAGPGFTIPLPLPSLSSGCVATARRVIRYRH